jgi:antitoxin Phd
MGLFMGKLHRKHKRTTSRKSRKVWQIQEAKAQFSELINEVIHDGYYTITKNGHPVAVIMSKDEFEKLQAPKSSLLEFLKSSPLADIELDLTRSKDLGRNIDL